MSSYRRELRTLARKHGWTVMGTSGGHIVLLSKAGRVYCPFSPRDGRRTLANTAARMKRLERAVVSKTGV